MSVSGAIRQQLGSVDIADSPGFNANAFLQDLAGKSTLEELMKKGSELAAGELI